MARLALSFLLISLAVQPMAAAETFDKYLTEARTALEQGKAEKALELVNKAIALDGKSAPAFFSRGEIHAAMRHQQEAIKDFSQTIKLDPGAADAFDRRGSEHFKLGHFKESIADFDRFLGLRPKEEPGHWRRGISYYYAGEFEKGAKQFEGYETVDANDVENAVWRYLCMVHTAGVEKARTSMLKIGHDKRVPMMTVYDLFRGKAKPEDVLQTAREGKPKPEELRLRLFYAHLYLGLYHEAVGRKKESLEHMQKAAEDYKVPGYMWEVARVHAETRRKERERK